MLNTEGQEPAKDTEVVMYLVEPFQKIEENFSALRSELVKNSIPFIEFQGFEEIN